MHPLLPSWPLLAAFLAASLALAVTPGPAVVYIVTRSLAHGPRSGLASVAGVAVGNLGNAIGASMGLAALFAVSSVAFTVVKYMGACYLFYLGVRALVVPPPEVAFGGRGDAGHRRVFGDGIVVALFNPKVTLFFAAFLPQFSAATPGVALQNIMLGVLFVAIAATTDTAYVLAAHRVASRLMHTQRHRTIGRYLAAGTMIGLGLFTAVAGVRTPRTR